MILLKDGTKRLLRAEEIECRVGQQTKDKSKYTVLLYKTSRTDMDILDEVFGSENWMSEHYEVKGKDFCRISVRMCFCDNVNGSADYGKDIKVSNYEWVGKSDCGKDYQRVAEDSDNKGLNEYEKSESSDSFKRAGFQWGIGRELYSAPKIWLEKEVDQYSLKVEAISYDENDKICDLVISGRLYGNKERETVYSFHNGKVVKQTPSKQETKPEPKAEPQPIGVDHETLEKIRDIVEKLEFEGKNTQEILDYYHVKSIGEISLRKWELMLAKVRGEA